MIIGYCRTNIDEYKREKWPEEFCCRPNLGDTVESESGKQLVIVQITHKVFHTKTHSNKAVVGAPYLNIELHRRTFPSHP